MVVVPFGWTTSRSLPAPASIVTPAGHHPEPYRGCRRSTMVTSAESLPILVTPPEVTEASTVNHFRVGFGNPVAEKSAWSTARQRFTAPVAQLGVAWTRESIRVTPSIRTSLIWSGVPAGQGSSRSTGTSARG
jgi:hypothetical protein